jgi:starch synthase
VSKDKRMRVLYAAAEVAPYAKSGEQADVASSLPRNLASLGLDVQVIMPMVRTMEMDSLVKTLLVPGLSVPLGNGRSVKCRIYHADMKGLSLFIVDNPKYFWREKVYGTGKGEYLDNDERYVLFNRAVLEFVRKHLKGVDVIHCNNWPTALIPLFLKTHYAKDPVLGGIKTVLTLHNIAYQGSFPPDSLSLTGLSWTYLTERDIAQDGQLNFLKAGILNADVLSTVSRSYRREILSVSRGFGLRDVLRKRRASLHSIRNGIDYEFWNPEKDGYIAASYGPPEFAGKRLCKKDLLREFKLEMRLDRPLLGILSYISHFKGFDIFISALESLLEMDLSLAVLGQGEEKYVRLLASAAERYPRRLAVRSTVTQELTHKMAAGADMFLIPSKFEPCGLSQLYGYRYATVPIVRATGGLAETVKPYDPQTRQGNGFAFGEYSASGLVAAVKEALRYYRRPDEWKRIMLAGFNENFSWRRSAGKYANIYRKSLHNQ